ncbi:MAG: beta-glucosidase [Ruminococcaceae bacterium]|nr:beta-glucosidase [Oscillospiraceae bacterium]
MTEKQLIELLNDLSFEEKIGELQQLSGRVYFGDDGIITGVDSNENLTEQEVNRSGSVINVVGPDKILKVQKNHIKNHPHHIPMIFMLDIIHGFGTSFPTPLAQSCSFDPELVKEIAHESAVEACNAGLHVTFSPMVDICRDARWGRVMEGSGEDPYLSSKMAEAAVLGYQGDDLSKEGTIAACVKHFAAYGMVEAGREYGTVDTSERFLRQYYLPSYKAACDAGSALLMTAFNANGGVPSTGDKHLLVDILRDEWGYNGAVITDYGSIRSMYSHGVTKNAKESAKLAMDAQVDIEMCSYCYHNGLPELVKTGEISMEQIDRAVLRVLQLKNKLGLFENPYRFTDAKKSLEVINNKTAMDLAQKAVSKTSVLLKNEDKILPLKKEEKIAFIGPYVYENDMYGGWSIRNQRKVEPRNIETVVKEKYPQNEFVFEQGSELLGADEPILKYDRARGSTLEFEADATARKQKIEKAVKAAKTADTVVMCIGEHTKVGGELAAKAYIDIPKIQKELFDAVAAVNKNIVVVLFDHRPLDITDISKKSKAVLNVWFPGIKAAEGIVDMLFGDAAPTGRLTMSFPYTVGQCPIYYSQLPTDHSPVIESVYATGYIDCQLTPLYSFGEGLTYTDFEYGELKLSKETLSQGETLTVSIDIKNIGERDGVETVQLYIRDIFASVSRPLKELKGFKKVEIHKGETVTVEFTLTPEDCMFYNTQLEYVWEPGEIQVFVGPNSKIEKFKSFELV